MSTFPAENVVLGPVACHSCHVPVHVGRRQSRLSRYQTSLDGYVFSVLERHYVRGAHGSLRTVYHQHRCTAASRPALPPDRRYGEAYS